MKNKKPFKYLGIILSVFILSGAGQVMAASFNLPVTADTLKVGDKFSANIQIDSEGTSINAAQVTLKFPADILQVASFENSNSVFTFWLQGPTFSNKDGTLSFTAGSTSGFSGPSLQVLTINFIAIANGTANLDLTNGAISASDGSGTNVLNKLNGTKVAVTTATAAPVPVIAAIPAPVQITRIATPAVGLPLKPALTVPLYPDPEAWYNLSSVFLVSWVLPSDITDVSTLVNKSPTSSPSMSEGLFNNKTFGALDNGIWYLHVRFKNSAGWGPTGHYKLAIDTTPPIVSNAQLSDGLSSDNPTPVLTFDSGDPLSGVASYYIKINGQDKVVIKGSPYTLSPQKPGKNTMIIGIQDNAGNITENTITFEIMPIPSPTITLLNKQIFTGEGGLVVSGQSLSNITVLLKIKNKNGDSLYSFNALATQAGTWVGQFDTPLKNGTYYVEATAQDARGALSLPVKSGLIDVRERPIMVIFGFGITYSILIIILLVILAGGYIIGWYFGRLTSTQRQRKILVSERDVSASFNVIKKDIEKSLKAWDDDKIEASELTQIEFTLKHINENIDKLQKYIISGIKDIGRK